MGTGVTTTTPKEEPFRALITRDDTLQRIAKAFPVTLSGVLDPQAFVQSALLYIDRDPTGKLKKSSQVSLLRSIIEAASYGLELDSVSGHAYLVPFSNKKKDGQGNETWVMEAQLMVGYRGLIKMLRNGDRSVADVKVTIVYENDLVPPGEFDYQEGLDRKLKHKPNWNMKDRGAAVGVYSVIFRTDRPADLPIDFHFMPIQDVYDLRNTYVKDWDKPYSPWTKDPEPMYRKTCLRQHMKLERLDKNLAHIVATDEARDLGFMRGDELVDPATEPAALPQRPRTLAGLEQQFATENGDSGETSQEPASQDAPGATQTGESWQDPDGIEHEQPGKKEARPDAPVVGTHDDQGEIPDFGKPAPEPAAKQRRRTPDIG